MKKIIILITCIVIAVICLIFYSFYSSKESNNLTKVKVAEVTHSVFYAPQYIALEKGFFKEEGLDIELTLTSGADNVMAAVLSGDADIGLSGSEATIYVYNQGEKDYIKTFAQLTQKDGSFLVSRENIKDFKVEDLKGKYIIGGREGGMPEMTLEYALKQKGIDPKKDLTIDTSIDFASMAGAFIGGTGDFVALFEPLATKVVNEGYGYKVAQLGTLTDNIPYTAYNAKTSYLENNKDTIKAFERAIQKGLDFVHEKTSDEITTAIMNQFPDTSYNDIKSAVESYKKNDTWPKNTTFTKESFDHMQDIVIEAGFLNKKVSYNDLIYGE
ncbi:MAG: ABC transporter substrate-binding protein [Bacilli bacterium]